MTPKVTTMSRSRPGSGEPSEVAVGTASAAASDTPPRNPDHATGNRWRALSPRAWCTARRSTQRTR